MSDAQQSSEFDLDELSPAEQQQLYQLTQKAAGEFDGDVVSGGLSRRGFLGTVGAATLSGLGVLGAVNESSEPAQAESTAQTVADGNVGEPNNRVDVYAASVDAEELSTVFTHRVSSAAGLETIDSNIQRGSIVRVEQPETPYRTSDWIDVDTSDVTVVFQSRFAKDGQAIVKPADGADVGGIRVGANASVEDVSILNPGFDGNQSTMTDSVKRLHGVIVQTATDVTIDNFFVTQTHPYHEHDSGGSGVTVRHQASDVTVKDGWIEDFGDRGIQSSGDSVTITGCTLKTGYDRPIALGVMEPDGSTHLSSGATVTENNCYPSSNGNGSGIGVSTDVVSLASGQLPLANISIVDNWINADTGGGNGIKIVGTGTESLSNIKVSDNTIAKAGNDGLQIIARDTSSIMDDPTIIVSDNVIRDPASAGIRCSVGGAAVDNNSIVGAGVDGIILNANYITAEGNSVHLSQENGIQISDFYISVTDSRITDSNQAAGGYSDIAITKAQNKVNDNLVSTSGADNIVADANANTINDNKQISGNGIVLNSDNNVVTGNHLAGGTIPDNGTGNIVTDNYT